MPAQPVDTMARDGIRFCGLRYLDLTLAAYVGEPVTIRYCGVVYAWEIPPSTRKFEALT